MVVSMLQMIIEIPGATSIKEKRSVLVSFKTRLAHKFKLSVAEVDLQQSLQFAQIGCAYVTNKQSHGESVLQKAVDYVEANIPGRIHDFQIHSEIYS